MAVYGCQRGDAFRDLHSWTSRITYWEPCWGDWRITCMAEICLLIAAVMTAFFSIAALAYLLRGAQHSCVKE